MGMDAVAGSFLSIWAILNPLIPPIMMSSRMREKLLMSLPRASSAL